MESATHICKYLCYACSMLNFLTTCTCICIMTLYPIAEGMAVTLWLVREKFETNNRVNVGHNDSSSQISQR